MPSTLNYRPSKDGLRIIKKKKKIIMLLTNYQIFPRYCLTLDQISMVFFFLFFPFLFCFLFFWLLFGLAESRLSNHISDSDATIPGYNVMRLDPKTHKTQVCCYTLVIQLT